MFVFLASLESAFQFDAAGMPTNRTHIAAEINILRQLGRRDDGGERNPGDEGGREGTERE